MELLIEINEAIGKWIEGMDWYSNHWYFSSSSKLKVDIEPSDVFWRRIRGITTEQKPCVSGYYCY